MAISQERPESPHSHKPPARRRGQAARSSLPATSPLPPYARTRRVVSWLALGLAGAEVIVGAVAVATPEPPGAYTGWGEDLTVTFITVVPLVAVGLALRSSRRGVARTTAVMALIFAALVSVTLLGYLFWGHDWSGFTLTQKTFASLEMIPPIAVYLAAFLAELPAFGRRWPIPPGG
jgi:FtsH-binding integral membrane protein